MARGLAIAETKIKVEPRSARARLVASGFGSSQGVYTLEGVGPGTQRPEQRIHLSSLQKCMQSELTRRKIGL